MRSWPDVRSWLQSHDPTGRGMCLQTSMLSYDADPIGASDATEAVELTDDMRRDGTPPAGAHVLWSGGSSGHGHSCVSDGDGYVWTVDWQPGLNITRVSIDAINDAWGGGSAGLDYEGWSPCYGNQPLDVPDLDPDPAPAPEDDMPAPDYAGSTTGEPLPLADGEWITLRITDAGDLSIVAGPARVSALVQVVASGLESGHQLAVRYKLVDCKSGEDSKRVSSYPAVEIIGTGGTTEGGVAQLLNIGAPADGWSRRLRAEAMTYDAGVVLESVQARTLTWPT